MENLVRKVEAKILEKENIAEKETENLTDLEHTKAVRTSAKVSSAVSQAERQGKESAMAQPRDAGFAKDHITHQHAHRMEEEWRV